MENIPGTEIVAPPEPVKIRVKDLSEKEYKRLIADIRNKATWGTAKHWERNILNIHDKKIKKHKRDGNNRT